MLKSLFKDLLNLLYPPLCVACREVLLNQERYICIKCLYNLPKTNFHLFRDNLMEQLFWGRVEIESAAAFYYFEKGSKCRKILHHIKYLGKKELALFMGRIYGRELSLSGRFTGGDMIIPVPLHPSREKQRGFNQSEWFARGLGESLGKTIANDILIRCAETETQTSKTRTERWENIENSFLVKYPEKIENKHILLVDDVVTTGATLESCAQTLKEAREVIISVLTLAYA